MPACFVEGCHLPPTHSLPSIPSFLCTYTQVVSSIVAAASDTLRVLSSLQSCDHQASAICAGGQARVRQQRIMLRHTCRVSRPGQQTRLMRVGPQQPMLPCLPQRAQTRTDTQHAASLHMPMLKSGGSVRCPLQAPRPAGRTTQVQRAAGQTEGPSTADRAAAAVLATVAASLLVCAPSRAAAADAVGNFTLKCAGKERTAAAAAAVQHCCIE